MLKGRILTWALVLTLLSVALIQAGQYSYNTDHGIKNPGSSGSMAFATLLRETQPGLTFAEDLSTKDGVYIIPFAERYREDLVSKIRKYKGKGTFVLYEVQDYETEALKTAAIKNYNADRQIGTLSGVNLPSYTEVSEWMPDFLPDAESIAVYTLPDRSDYTIASLDKQEDKRAFYFRRADGILNKHLAKTDNAAIFVGFLNAANPEKRPAVFVTGYLDGGGGDGIVQKLGPGFHGAWNQFLFLVAVIFVTLNVRFGKPPEPRAKQRAARELVDGIANLTRRKRLGRWALQAVFDSTMLELERRRRTSRTQILNRPEDFLNEEQVAALEAARIGLDVDLDEMDALKRAKNLRKLV